MFDLREIGSKWLKYDYILQAELRVLKTIYILLAQNNEITVHHTVLNHALRLRWLKSHKRKV